MKVITNKIDDSWLDWLREFGYTSDTVWENGEHEDLKAKLLEIGGEAVIIVNDDDKNKLMSRGVALVNPKVRKVFGFNGQCHKNSAKMYAKCKKPIEIMTGWALSDDGVWRMHSWLRDGETILETTELRVAYFGFAMSKSEAETFVKLEDI